MLGFPFILLIVEVFGVQAWHVDPRVDLVADPATRRYGNAVQFLTRRPLSVPFGRFTALSFPLCDTQDNEDFFGTIDDRRN